MTRLLWIIMVFASSLLGATAGAHHSSAPHYDANKPIEIEGTIESFEFVNPHAFLHVNVVDADGNTAVWDCEMPAAGMLRRQGWSADVFEAGQPITVRGIAARRDPHGCSIQTVVTADGREMPVRGPLTASVVQRPAAGAAAQKSASPIIGVWVRDQPRRRNGRGPAPGGGPPGPGGPAARAEFTSEGLKAQSGYDQRFDDPSFQCSAASIVRAWSEPGTPTEITIDGNRATIHHEYMDTVRSIDLGTHEHPANLTPSLFGHSVGWTEDQTLIIDTVGFTAGVLFPHPGILHSDALHIVERLSADPTTGTLQVAWTAEDPKFLEQPLTGTFSFHTSPYPVETFDCTVEHANR